MSMTAQQKIRLLIVYDFLQSQTDENHTASIAEMIAALDKRGISVSRKTLYDDIALLNEYGYDVICVRGRSNRYFVGERKFERPEVQILLNAIGATQTLPMNKTKKLLQKLLQLLGIGEATQLCNLVPISSTKHSNERVYYSIDAITTALLQKKQLSFLYFNYGANGKREYRENGEPYIVNPLGMVYSCDNLYLICYHDNHENPVHYRIDRMDETAVTDKIIKPMKEFENFDLEAYRQALFDMDVGEEQEVDLAFPQELLEVAIDRFGENIALDHIDDEYIIHSKIQAGNTFFAWLTTFEGRVKIKAPEALREKYVDFIKILSKNVN